MENIDEMFSRCDAIPDSFGKTDGTVLAFCIAAHAEALW